MMHMPWLIFWPFVGMTIGFVLLPAIQDSRHVTHAVVMAVSVGARIVIGLFFDFAKKPS